MPHLLHIDSSIQGERSVSRALTARAAAAWRAAHPAGVVTYRDLGADPPPHLDSATGTARMIPAGQRTPAQQASWELTERLAADTNSAARGKLPELATLRLLKAAIAGRGQSSARKIAELVAKKLGVSGEAAATAIAGLLKDGLIEKKGAKVRVP